MGNTKRKYGEYKEWPGGWVSQEVFDDQGNLIGYMDRVARHKGGSYNIYNVDGGLIAKDFRNAQSAREALILINSHIGECAFNKALDILSHRFKEDRIVYVGDQLEPTIRPISPFKIEWK